MHIYFHIVGGVSVEYIPIDGIVGSKGAYIHTYLHSFVTYYLTTIFEERRTSRSKQNIHGPNASVGGG